MSEHKTKDLNFAPKSLSSRALDAARLWADSARAARHEDSLFIWIPKNAGTSVYTMLQRNGLVKLTTPRAVRLFFRDSGRVTFGHMGVSSLVEHGFISKEFVDRAFKFAISRDPYARAASLYRVYSKIMVNWHEPASFTEFFTIIADGFYDRVGPYDRRALSQCNPQVEWLRGAWPDKIYKVENLSEFSADIADRWGIAAPDVLHTNWTARDEPPNLERKEKSLVEQIYAEDFERLGYSKR